MTRLRSVNKIASVIRATNNLGRIVIVHSSNYLQN